MSAQRSPMRLLAPPRSARPMTSRLNSAETMSPPGNSGERVLPLFIGLHALCQRRQRSLSSLFGTAHGRTFPSPSAVEHTSADSGDLPAPLDEEPADSHDTD